MLSEQVNFKKYFVKFVKYWIPFFIWCGLISWMSTDAFSSDQSSKFIMPVIHYLFPWLLPQDVDFIHWLIRKAAHLVVYFVLGCLLFRALCGDALQKWCLRLSVYSVILLTIFALVDELHQSSVPSRTFLLSDVAINSSGVMFSQIAIILREKIIRH